MIKKWTKILSVGLLCGFSCTVVADERPNVLIFLVDDMGLMDTSVPFVADENGEPLPQNLNAIYRTPNMEKLAANGVRFSHFYANSVCSPSRHSLLNGQSSARHRVTQWINPQKKNPGPDAWRWEGMNEKEVSLQKLFKEAGYSTLHAGKAHLAPFGQIGEDPTQVHFDINIAGAAIGRPDSYYGEKNYGSGIRHVKGLESYHGSDVFLTEAVTRETIKAITALSKKDEPFFVHRSHYAVHSPFNSDPRFLENYDDVDWPKHAKAFATLVEGMDRSLGDMISHLETIGEAENTLVIFLGDNGSDAPLHVQRNFHDINASAPFRGKKGTHYEGGMLAPLIISWAKPNPSNPNQQKFPIKTGLISDTFARIYDIFPTLAEVAGLEVPKTHVVDGHSLKTWVAEHEGEQPKNFLMHFPHGHRSTRFTVLRQGVWKLIQHRDPSAKEAYELFNLKKDPYEFKNLVDSHPEQLARMKMEMMAALKESDAVTGEF